MEHTDTYSHPGLVEYTDTSSHSYAPPLEYAHAYADQDAGAFAYTHEHQGADFHPESNADPEALSPTADPLPMIPVVSGVPISHHCYNM